MGIETTYYMDCDKCGNDLTDTDGLYTSGRKQWLEEHAGTAGWKYENGWICGACQVKIRLIAEITEDGK